MLITKYFTKPFTKPRTKDPLMVCIICLDDSQLIPPIKLDVAINELQFNKSCNCLCDIHVKCVKEWLSVSHKCPICRMKLMERVNHLNWTNQYPISHHFDVINGIPVRRRTISNQIKLFLSNVAFLPIYLIIHIFVMYTIVYSILKGFSHVLFD
jgi:hypothetical protein